MGFRFSLTPSERVIADGIAAHFIASAAPIRFSVAQSADEQEAAYRLRYEAVIDQGWAKPEMFPTGLEQDDYDAQAVHLLGWDDQNHVVATTRLVFPTAGKLLPTEVEFKLSMEPQGQVVDGGRTIVAKAYSDYRHRIFAGLLGYTWFEIQARDFYYLGGAAVPAMIRLCRSIGHQITVLGPAQPYWGEQRYPLRFDVPESIPMLFDRWGQVLMKQEERCQ
ncbi:MAG: GNAT family N-acetyltransferase [Anaerolineae bacterium]|nr:GNAT family N-acetyltransferase [Anaerolineae bacterium]